LAQCTRKADGTYIRGPKNEKETFTRIELQEDIAAYLGKLADEPCCINSRGDATSCKCLQFLSDKPVVCSSIADRMISQFDMEVADRKVSLASEYRNAKRCSNPRHDYRTGPERNYGLPLSLVREDFTDEEKEDVSEANFHGICEAAWSTINNLGKTALGTIKAIAEGKASPTHKMQGKRNAETQEMLEAKQAAKEYVQDIVDNNSYEHAMRFVRDMAGHTSTREESGRVFLPPSFSKRNWYMRFCGSRGWKITFLCRGKCKFKKLTDWELQDGFYKTQEEADANDGEVAKPIMSWRSFNRMWDKEFSQVHVAQRGEDTCTDCHMLRIKLQALDKKKTKAEEDLANGGSDDGTTPEQLEEIIADIKVYTEECEKHLKMHQAQRELYNKLKAIAEADVENLVAIDLMTLFLVIDMSQNGSTPCLAGDQMGDFYYMSPLSHYIFGICEPARKFMNNYIWEEGTAGRGANNIISCLYYDLVKRGIIGSTGKPLKHLVIAADNCSAQNKNKAMIKFCMWLVEAGWVEEVTLMFLVKGHTKNDCDKMFNNLKQGTKGKNIWTGDDLDEAYMANNAEFISLTRINGDDTLASFWRDWAEGLGKVYRDPPPGTILDNHVFEYGRKADADEEESDAEELAAAQPIPLTYTCKEFRDSTVQNTYDLRPAMRQTIKFAEINGMTDDERATKIIELPDQLPVLEAPGLAPIKANEMQNKIGPLAPEDKRYYFERLTEDLKKQYDAAKKKKNSEKTEAKKTKKKRTNDGD
jgi:hypothetical protein